MINCFFRVKLQFWIFLFIYGIGVQISLAQPSISFGHLTIENGLSSGSVLSIVQDQKGFLWVGTMDGLNRYDGKRIKIYKRFYRDNPIGPSIKINRLLADKKNNLWIGTNNGLYLYNHQTDSFRVFYHSPSQRTSIADNFINELYLDKQGNVWIGTKNGLNKLAVDDTGFAFQTMPLRDKNGPFTSMDVQAVFEVSTGQLLVGTTKGLICFPNTLPGHQKKNDVKISLYNVHVMSVCEDTEHNIWTGTSGHGVYRLDTKMMQVKNFLHSPLYSNGLVSNIVRKIFTDRSGRIWIGTLKGLNIYVPATDEFDSYQHNPTDKNTLNFNSIYDMFEDRQGNVWVGTFFGGLNVAESFTTAFKVYRNEGKEHEVSSNVIGPILADRQNNLWIGTEAEGLNYFDRKSHSFKHYKGGEPGNESLTSNLVKALAYDPYDRLWVGMHGGGINILDHSGKIIKRIKKGEGSFITNSNDVIALLPDRNNRMWIGTEEDGISIYDFKTDKAVDFNALYPGMTIANKAITCLFEDSKQNIWIGTRQGLSMLQANGKKLKNYLKSSKPYQLQSDYINCIVEDKKGIIWIGTYAGLSYYDPSSEKIGNYAVEDGLAGNKVGGIISDNKNNLWLSTNNGLSRFDTGSKHFNNFNVLDGLPGNVFNYKSFSKVGDGHFYFGGFAGLVEFKPNQIQLNTVAPQIVLTGLTVNGKPVPSRDHWGILQKDISATNMIEMKYNQNLISIDYAVMNFIKADKNRSAYKLEGYDLDWVYTDGQTASFTNLPPGNYRLLIKACNNDGVWNNTPVSLVVTILPPPWKTWWAYTLYVLGIGLLVFGVVYFFVTRTAMRRKLRYEHMVNTKQQELHQMKIDFFTHISHEIRTPLTLIMGPVEVLMDMIPPRSAASKLLHNIKNNAERMLKLTTDLLEFRKSDSGYTQLKISSLNVVSFSREVFGKFTNLAKEKQLDFRFSSREKNILLYIDPHYMEIILTNLLSNAIKFTPNGGKVSASVIRNNDETVDIIICDNGMGISDESRDKIFTSFYQADSVGEKHVGSGIGLAFSKNLVELHGGKLYFRCGVNSDTQERETCFIINLRCGLNHFNDSSLIERKLLNNAL